MTERAPSSQRKRAFAVIIWPLAVLVLASQWYIYDSVHHQAERVIYYVLTCAYLCGVLTPLVLWLGRKRPFDSRTWKQNLSIHIAASLTLTAIGVFVEATAGWLPNASHWSYSGALRHYFTQHTQVSLIAYWVLLGVVHIYRMYDQARVRELHAAQLEAQLSEAHLAALRNQLQPHFLFNTLQAATTLIYDDPSGAEEILLSLGELLRTSLQSLRQQEVPLCNEIEFLRHYAAIQQRRFGDRLRFDFQIDRRVQSCAVPSLLLQPLVENAIRHGIGVREQPDLILIQASIDGGRMIVEIRNSASALDDTLERLVSRGLGIANTIGRLERLYGSQQSFTIRNLSPLGVAVSLSIPVRFLSLPAARLEAQAV